MIKTYKLKPPVTHPDFAYLDKQKRQRIEKALNKKFTDFEWNNYKVMVMPKNEKQK